jgi:lauroyl/myristoyl acyltransferase
VRLPANLSRDLNRIRMVKDPSFRVTHFDRPITYGIMLKHIMLRRMEALFYSHCSDGMIARITGNGVAREAVARLRERGGIIVFVHQPFVLLALAMLCANGVVLNTLPLTPSVSRFKARLLAAWPRNYRRIPYQPVMALKKITERLKAGECVFLAADGRKGKHHLTVKFGNGTSQTPRGIYELARATGAPIVPVLLRLRPFPAVPGFDLEVGDPWTMEKAPEEELERIEGLFSWYFNHLREQPYMWKRIANFKYSPASPPREAS